MANEETKPDVAATTDKPGADATAAQVSAQYDSLRGEVSDEDLRDLDTAVEAVDFASRKASPERLARLKGLHARLGDLIEQIEKGVRKRKDRAALTPDDEQKFAALVEEGIGLGEAGKLPEALEKLEAALRIDPEGSEALFNLGVLYGILAHKNQAKGEFYDSRVRDETWAAKAISAYERVLELDPENVHALNNLATLYALLDERDVAIETLKRSLAIKPDQAGVKNELEELEGSS